MRLTNDVRAMLLAWERHGIDFTWEGMPALADALEEAGCSEIEILDQMRQRKMFPYVYALHLLSKVHQIVLFDLHRQITWGPPARRKYEVRIALLADDDTPASH